MFKFNNLDSSIKIWMMLARKYSNFIFNITFLKLQEDKKSSLRFFPWILKSNLKTQLNE